MKWLRKLIEALIGARDASLIKPVRCFICGYPTEWTSQPYFRCTGPVPHTFNAYIDYTRPLDPKPPTPPGEI